MKRMTAIRDHDQFIVERLKKDPRFLEAYLNEALNDENEDPRVVLSMIRKVVEAKRQLATSK